MQNKEAHVLNKREMFDGMRAYHNSETVHKNDAINLIKSLITGTVALYAAILASVFSPQISLPGCVAIILGWLAFLIITAPTLLFCLFTHIKISSDHSRYADFLKEYARECKHLGILDAEVEINGTPTKVKILNEDPIAGRGYRRSQYIIWTSGGAVILIALCLAMVVTVLAK